MNKPLLMDTDKDLNRTGYAHIAFSVGSKEAVDELTAKIKDAGYEVVSGPRTTGDGYYESCIVAIEGRNHLYVLRLILISMQGLGEGIIDHSFLKYKRELLEYDYCVGKISMKEETVMFQRVK